MIQKIRMCQAKRIALLFLCVLLVMTAATPISALAQETRETIRVGWHEEPYFITDQYGRRSGYSYEYQWKVAAYTGWDYEYVEGSWPELLQMLKNGEIDMMSNVSYMEERTEDMLYASLPMGTESYYIFVSPDNTEITADDYSSLEGKRIGVTKGSIQKDLFEKWAKMHGIEVELIELTTPDEESQKLLGTDLDAFVTIDVYGDPDKMRLDALVKMSSSAQNLGYSGEVFNSMMIKRLTYPLIMLIVLVILASVAWNLRTRKDQVFKFVWIFALPFCTVIIDIFIQLILTVTGLCTFAFAAFAGNSALLVAFVIYAVVLVVVSLHFVFKKSA